MGRGWGGGEREGMGGGEEGDGGRRGRGWGEEREGMGGGEGGRVVGEGEDEGGKDREKTQSQHGTH